MATPIAAPPSIPFTCLPTGCDITSLAGSIYWGVAVSTAIFGSNLVLGWTYANNNTDHWILRIAVATLFILDGVSTGFDHRFVVQYLIVNFGSLINLQGSVDPSQAIGYLLTQIVIFIVQIFFASRIYLLRRTHWIVTATVVALAVASFAAGLGAFDLLLFRCDWLTVNAKVGNIHELNNASLTDTVNSNVSKIAFGICSSLAALCDIIVTAALFFTFQQSKTGFKRTNSMIQRLIQYAIGRGILVAIFPICHVSVYLASSQKGKVNMNWMPFIFIVGKVYIMTMLVMLNSRASIRNEGGDVVTTSGMSYATGTTDRFQSIATPALNSIAARSESDLELKNYSGSNGHSTVVADQNTYDLRDQSKGVYVTKNTISV
ncbi:hypothetical protein K435DRAFT_859396 [Dendrothele bispora CBS 962.96]|uniref:DUF6534 domain-containing protein n=1 Tax=Dendrothele bispora (strain CBS 962.96) TaxID=1314807 RepID=A0A4S8M133_DENBC|nr:hypothetical protein K435DRAFT_859396 [Dendrothele bispora CBS 962.96]